MVPRKQYLSKEGPETVRSGTLPVRGRVSGKRERLVQALRKEHVWNVMGVPRRPA